MKNKTGCSRLLLQLEGIKLWAYQLLIFLSLYYIKGSSLFFLTSTPGHGSAWDRGMRIRHSCGRAGLPQEQVLHPHARWVLFQTPFTSQQCLIPQKFSLYPPEFCNTPIQRTLCHTSNTSLVKPFLFSCVTTSLRVAGQPICRTQHSNPLTFSTLCGLDYFLSLLPILNNFLEVQFTLLLA